MLRAIRRATAPSCRTVQSSRGTSQASQTRSIGPWFEGSPPARSTPAERSLARRSLSFVRVALALAMTCAAFGMPRCTAFGPSPRRNFSQISTRCRTSCSAQGRLRPFNSTLPGRAASFQLESPWPRCWNDSGIRRHSFWSFVAAAVGGRATAGIRRRRLRRRLGAGCRWQPRSREWPEPGETAAGCVPSSAACSVAQSLPGILRRRAPDRELLRSAHGATSSARFRRWRPSTPRTAPPVPPQFPVARRDAAARVARVGRAEALR
jgi:hypothetical protein